VLVLFCLSRYLCWCCFVYLLICDGVVFSIKVFVLVLFFLSKYLCWCCSLDNPRRFPNFQLPTIGVTADFYILHFLDNRRCSYTINFVQSKHNFCCRWTCFYTHIQGLARSQTSWVLQSTLALNICSHFSIHTLKVT
jgi:hypothetical protein